MNCFNPACNRELRYLRDGRVVRVLRGNNEQPSMEHYWLCGACYQVYDTTARSVGPKLDVSFPLPDFSSLWLLRIVALYVSPPFAGVAPYAHLHASLFKGFYGARGA